MDHCLIEAPLSEPPTRTAVDHPQYPSSQRIHARQRIAVGRATRTFQSYRRDRPDPWRRLSAIALCPGSNRVAKEQAERIGFLGIEARLRSGVTVGERLSRDPLYLFRYRFRWRAVPIRQLS
jgi:hypothetical protein